MANACVLLAVGFEEIEAVTVVDVLRRAEIAVRTVAIESIGVQGAHGLVVTADTTLSEAQNQHWDLVVLPGGMPGAKTLRDNKQVQGFLAAQPGNTTVAAICAAPIALAKAGLLAGKHATSYPGFEQELTRGGATTSQANVVQDGRIVTSRGPGTAMEFALALVERLTGPEKAAALRAELLTA